MTNPDVPKLFSPLAFKILLFATPKLPLCFIRNFTFSSPFSLKGPFPSSGIRRLYQIKKRGGSFLFGDFKRGQLKVDVKVSEVLIYQMSHPQRSASTVLSFRELPTLTRKGVRGSNKNCKEKGSPTERPTTEHPTTEHPNHVRPKPR